MTVCPTTRPTRRSPRAFSAGLQRQKVAKHPTHQRSTSALPNLKSSQMQSQLLSVFECLPRRKFSSTPLLPVSFAKRPTGNDDAMSQCIAPEKETRISTSRLSRATFSSSSHCALSLHVS